MGIKEPAGPPRSQCLGPRAPEAQRQASEERRMQVLKEAPGSPGTTPAGRGRDRRGSGARFTVHLSERMM